MAQDHDQFMRMALEEADNAGSEGNIAVGSVITSGDSVVAKGRNLVNSTLDVTAHCETDALRNGGKALGHVDFSGHTLYTTAEPCPMCCGVGPWNPIRSCAQKRELGQRRGADVGFRANTGRSVDPR